MVTLTDANDTFDQDNLGNTRPDTINALGGDDLILTSTLGGSLVQGGVGNDSLVSNGPSGTDNSGQPDTLRGEEGDDSLKFQASAGFGFGDEGNDTLEAVSRATLYGGVGDDFMYGLLGNNWYSANEGNDIVLIGGNDTIYGGMGQDTIVFSTSTGQLPPLDDLDDLPELSSITGDDNFISANRNQDLVVGWGDRDKIYGGKDNDTLYSLGNQAFLSGDSGNDTLIQLNQEQEGLPIDPTAIALVSIERSTLLGGEGNDYIQGAVGAFGEGRNSLDGGAGDDSIIGQAARDTLVGGAGNDIITTGLLQENQDKFDVNGLPVTLSGFSGNNRLDGGDGNDTLISGFFTDTMIGGTGSDCLTGIFNSVDGGADNDTIDATAISTNASGGEEITVTLIGGAGNDSLVGSNQSSVTNLFDGGTGNDFIQFGGTTNDQLIGNLEGDDTIIANATNTDSYTIQDTLGNNTITGGLGGDTLVTGEGNDSIVGVDSTETGVNANDDGNDSISAGGGNDILFGRGGTDTILGGSGDDYIALGLNSTNDDLTGGEGNDSFVYFDPSATNTIIRDFNSSEDIIVLDLAGFGLANSQQNGAIASADFVSIDPGDNYVNSDARDTTPVIIYEQAPVGADGSTIDSGLLKYDPNGSDGDLSEVITIARLNGNPDLQQGDILIV